MKVILTQAVPGVGDAGAVMEVADGYARNFLLPKKLAVVATKGSLRQAESQAGVYARRADKAMTEAQQAAAAVEGKTITIRARAGSENRLYGSVTPTDLAEALQQQFGIALDRRKIALDEPIHRLGTYTATADFGQGASAKFTVEVAAEVAGAHGKAARGTGEAEGAAPVQEMAAGAEAEDEGAGEQAAPAEGADEDAAEEQVEANPS
jgi:large subunit ribosomal protein L9